MVTRKPVQLASNEQNSIQPPYPTTPSSPIQHFDSFSDLYDSSVAHLPQHEQPQDYRDDLGHPQWQSRPPIPRIPSMSDMSDGWADGSMDFVSIPQSQNVGEGGMYNERGDGKRELPQSLRIGSGEATPRTSSESQRPSEHVEQSNNTHQEKLHEHNPFAAFSKNPYRRQGSAERTQPESMPGESQEQSSVDAWAEQPPPPPMHAPPPPPPQLDQTLGVIGDLSLSESSWQDAPSNLQPDSYHELHPEPEGNLISFNGNEALHSELTSWPSPFASDLDNRTVETLTSHIELPTEESYAPDRGQSPFGPPEELSPPQELSGDSPQTARATSLDYHSSYKNLPTLPTHPLEEAVPELPPRRSQEQEKSPPRQSPRNSSFQTGADPSRSRQQAADVESPQARANQQRSETYQIKHISWVDATSRKLRTSPIMVQNANGPCPLLALVNALTLSTPANADTALVETLRVREQVSLGLLLDAVFDELMSGRRGDAAQELPDVGDLYSFLVTLHTGMNVNPRFVATSVQPPNLMDDDEQGFPEPIDRIQRPGGFEETKEMKLYSTFSIPLIHGWLPPPAHPAQAALRRSARTYEDAQNLMFRDEELEERLQNRGLSQDEQLLLEDIVTIKYFLSSTATQLTGYGLDTITASMLPGSIAILFRNDHFSTLYKHPDSGQLLTLVTDMGYAGHDEVVWESLVDISGEGCEFFAGDFRPVGNTPGDTNPQPNNSSFDDNNWTTVSRNTRNNNAPKPLTTHSRTSTSGPPPPLSASSTYNLPTSPSTEQEDHDLALAMQLQEEEEDRSRRETEARRREDELSQAFLSQQGNARPPVQPPRPNARRSTATRNPSNSQSSSQTIRPLIPPRGPNNSTPAPAVRRDPEAGEEAPPPSYEQAAKSSPYIPSSSQPFPPVQGAPVRGGIRHGEPSAYSQHAMGGNVNAQHTNRRSSAARAGAPLRGGSYAPGMDVPGLPRRRTSAGLNGLDEDERRDKDCVVM